MTAEGLDYSPLGTADIVAGVRRRLWETHASFALPGKVTHEWQPHPLESREISTAAERYEDAVSDPLDPRVRGAYHALLDLAERMIHATGIRVERDDDDQGWPTNDTMALCINRYGVLAIEAPSVHPIWSPDEYLIVRAWHDLFGHVAFDYDFDRYGEFAAWQAHRQVTGYVARRALGTEFHGQNSSMCWYKHTPEVKTFLWPAWAS